MTGFHYNPKTEVGLVEATRKYLQVPTFKEPEPQEVIVQKVPRTIFNRNTCFDLIRDYLPDYCWMTLKEIYAMLLEVDDELEIRNVSVALYTLKNKRQVVCKGGTYVRGRENYLYIKAGRYAKAGYKRRSRNDSEVSGS